MKTFDSMKFGVWLFSVVLFCILLSLQTVKAQNKSDQEWKNWTAKDAEKILYDSPLSKNCANTDVSFPCGKISKSSFTISNHSQAKKSVPVRVRFESSLRIRQALLRLRQIYENYDKMSFERRAEFDKATKDYLACDICKNYYIITLLQSAVEENNKKSVFSDKIKSKKPSDLADEIYLINDKNEKRNLSHFEMRGSFTVNLYFAKFDDRQNSLITNTTKKTNLVIKTDFWANGFLEEIVFDIQKMLIGGKLDL